MAKNSRIRFFVIYGLTSHIEAGFFKVSINFRIRESWEFSFLGSGFYRLAIGFIAITGRNF